jgi:hypothetical protein
MELLAETSSVPASGTVAIHIKAANKTGKKDNDFNTP